MEDLIQTLTEGLLKLREDFNNLPNYEDDLKNINTQLEKLQSNQLSQDDIRSLVITLATGYFATQKQEYTQLMNELLAQLKQSNQDELSTYNDKIDTLINQAINTIKSDLDKFKSTIKNGKDGLNGLNGRDGKDGRDGQSIKGDKGDKGLNGIDGKDGIDGVGINDITYKNGIIKITLSNGTSKDIKLNIPTSFGGGGISETRVLQLISESIGQSLDAYTKAETDELVATAIDDLINGASSILDSFGEVESVLGTLQTSINANSQAIANLATAQGQFGSSTTQTITTNETPLDFDVIIPSTDTNVLNLDGTLNRCSFNIDASFNFRTDMEFYVNHNVPILVTIRGRNVLDNSLVYYRTVEIHQTSNTVKSVSTNTLLTIGKNGFPSSDLTIYFTIQATDSGIDITNFTSTLTSSSQYDLGTISYTKAESDDKYIAKSDENLFIQDTEPTLATGKQALWIDTTDGNITFNLVIGD